VELKVKYFCNILFLIAFSAASMASASDVIMAKTEDLKEFDRLISKDPKAPPQVPPNAQSPQGQQPRPQKPNGDKKNQNREKFEVNNQGQDPKNKNRNQGPRRGGRPPAGPDTRPPPGNQPPPPPPPN
jgi:hypothetical protein